MGQRRRTQSVEIIEILPADEAHFASWHDDPFVLPRPSTGGGERGRPAVVALAAIAAVVVAGLVVASIASDDSHAATAPTTTEQGRLTLTPVPPTDVAATVVTVSSGGACSDDRVPFHPTFLPGGWQTDGAVWSGPDLLTGGTGAVRAVHGQVIPAHGDAVSSLTVLGVPASIAPVADGYSVEFVLGAPSDLCDHWALVASKGVAAATLQRIAEGMSPFDGGAQALSCRQTYPTLDADLEGQRVVLDAVVMPTRRLPTIPDHLPNGVVALFAKETLLVRPGASVQLTLVDSSRGTAGMSWQDGRSPVAHAEMPGCTSSAPWLASIGGFWVLEPQCISLEIVVGGQASLVRVGIGIECP